MANISATPAQSAMPQPVPKGLLLHDDVFWAQHDPAVEQEFAGQWVVALQRQIISHGRDPDAVLEEAARVTKRSKNELIVCAIPIPDGWLADA